ncbi:MAG TPA: MFS transporter [Bryobacteraceae bacterium]|nr:MFS transporter [Bryobacteraceae bacterium]
MATKPVRSSAAQPAEPPYPSPRYAWYVVGVLTLMYVFSFIDRQIFSLIVAPLRRDLGISDTQVSLLQGFSFALFYTFCGIPLGRLADKYSRRGIIACGLVAWSAFTSMCGLAKSFGQMLFWRMGVGVGEAALSPAAYSIITDDFPKEKLATAISVYSMGIYIGSGLSFLLGGLVVRFASAKALWTLPLVGNIRPWQLIFLAVGIPGLIATVLLATVKEPFRRGVTAANKTTAAQSTAYIFKNKSTFLCHNAGFGLLSLVSYASAAWVPEFFRRVYHWDIPKIGLVYGTMVAIFGVLGIVGAGRIADAVRARGTLQANMLVGVFIALLWIPVHFLLFLAPSATWAVVWLAPACVFAAAPFGIAPAAIQQMMPPAMRGQASAVYLFILNLIGLGLGPTAVAFFTQHVFGRDEAVNYSLLVVAVSASLLAAALLWAGVKPFLRSLDRLNLWIADERA